MHKQMTLSVAFWIFVVTLCVLVGAFMQFCAWNITFARKMSAWDFQRQTVVRLHDHLPVELLAMKISTPEMTALLKLQIPKLLQLWRQYQRMTQHAKVHDGAPGRISALLQQLARAPSREHLQQLVLQLMPYLQEQMRSLTRQRFDLQERQHHLMVGATWAAVGAALLLFGLYVFSVWRVRACSQSSQLSH
jgi:heme/copper-type cytochrome/quinol oxidase subunit 2